jgi:hypothetical protein
LTIRDPFYFDFIEGKSPVDSADRTAFRIASAKTIGAKAQRIFKSSFLFPVDKEKTVSPSIIVKAGLTARVIPSDAFSANLLASSFESLHCHSTQ